MHPLGFFFRNMSAWGFFLFPANKKIIETLPKLQLYFLLKKLADPAMHRGHWKNKRAFCWVCHVTPFILCHIQQLPGPDYRSEKADRERSLKNRQDQKLFLLFCSQRKCQTHQPGCWGAKQGAELMAIHHLVSLPKAITVACRLQQWACFCQEHLSRTSSVDIPIVGSDWFSSCCSEKFWSSLFSLFMVGHSFSHVSVINLTQWTRWT